MYDAIHMARPPDNDYEADPDYDDDDDALLVALSKPHGRPDLTSVKY